MKSNPFSILLCMLLAGVWASCSQETVSDAVTAKKVEPTAEQQVSPLEKPSSAVPPAQPEIPAAPKPPVPTISSRIQELCDNPDRLPDPFRSVRSEVLQVVIDLYQQQNYQPWWFEGEKFKPSLARNALEAFAIAESHALNPGLYPQEALADRISFMDGVSKADRLSESAITDFAFTLGMTVFAYDLHLGRVPHQKVVSTWAGVDKTLNAESLLTRLRDGEKAVDVLESFAPQQQAYQLLQQALATYRKLAVAGGWEAIDPALLNEIKDRELEKGRHAIVGLIRQRLKQEGYEVSVPEDQEAANVYDESLKEVMRQFQGNRGLEPDGIVGPLTVEAMNLPAEDLVEKIVWSMDRWRWLPQQLGERHILVNVPEFKLRAYDAGQEALQMRVIVGDSTKGTITPLFADEMEYVIFRPYWNVPKSIVEEELVPEIKKDRKYIKKFNYEIVETFSPQAEVLKPSRQNIERLENEELKIRQTAGPYNALGLVKFIFPNEHAVYLHDTNQRNLFVYSKRDMSHGCIRVHEPEALARYALPADPWTEEKIHEAMYGEESERKSVSVGNKIPVYIFYLTAFPSTGEGPLGFFQDVYQKDARMAAYDSGEPLEVPES